MPLVKATLKSQIVQGLKNIHPNENDPDGAINAFADAIANAVDAYVKSATVTVNAGIPVTTAGSPTAQTGATTGPGTGSLS